MFKAIRQIIGALLKVDDMVDYNGIDNYSVYPQTWGSTTLGFGGIGGSVMTTAPTTAIEVNGKIYVFFGERFAYSKEVEDLPDGLYTKIFYMQDAPSVSEFQKLTFKQ